MVFDQNRYAIVTFARRKDAEQALNELYSAGFPITQIFFVTNETDCDHQRSIYGKSRSDNPDGIPSDRTLHTGKTDGVKEIDEEGAATAGAIIGSILGAIGGCFVGLGLLSMPGFVLAVALGTSGTTLVTTLTGAALGAAGCGLIEAIASLESSEDRAKADTNQGSQSEYLVMVDGTDDEVRCAKSILLKVYSRSMYKF